MAGIHGRLTTPAERGEKFLSPFIRGLTIFASAGMTFCLMVGIADLAADKPGWGTLMLALAAWNFYNAWRTSGRMAK